MNARTQTDLARWTSILALAAGLFSSTTALASPIFFSTSGTFDLPSGTAPLLGVTDATPQDDDDVVIGAVPASQLPVGPESNTPFQLHFTFNNGLKPIDVSGVIPSIGYNTDWPIL